MKILVLLVPLLLLTGCFFDVRSTSVDVYLDVRVLENAQPIEGQKVWYKLTKFRDDGMDREDSFESEAVVSTFAYTDEDGIILKRLGAFNVGSGEAIHLDVTLVGPSDPKPSRFDYTKAISSGPASKLPTSNTGVAIWQPSFYIDVGQ